MIIQTLAAFAFFALWGWIIFTLIRGLWRQYVDARSELYRECTLENSEAPVATLQQELETEHEMTAEELTEWYLTDPTANPQDLSPKRRK